MLYRQLVKRPEGKSWSSTRNKKEGCNCTRIQRLPDKNSKWYETGKLAIEMFKEAGITTVLINMK